MAETDNIRDNISYRQYQEAETVDITEVIDVVQEVSSTSTPPRGGCPLAVGHQLPHYLLRRQVSISRTTGCRSGNGHSLFERRPVISLCRL